MRCPSPFSRYMWYPNFSQNYWAQFPLKSFGSLAATIDIHKAKINLNKTG